MKQFMVLLATLPIMLLLLAQFALDQTNSIRMAAVNDCVYTAKEEAKQAGAFTSEIQTKLRNHIAEALKIDSSKISISSNATSLGQIQRMTKASASDAEWKSHLIHYTVTVPIGDAMAGAGFMGIRNSDNVLNYTIDSYTASEYLP